MCRIRPKIYRLAIPSWRSEGSEQPSRLLLIPASFSDFLQQIAALCLLLESSPLYSVLSTLPEPEPTAPTSTTTFTVQEAVYNSLPTLEQLVDLNESEEADFLKREVEKRRTRLGAPPLERLKLDVGLEVWELSQVRLSEPLNGLRSRRVAPGFIQRDP